MFLKFFANLREAHVPATPREYLDLMRAVEGDLAQMSVDEFYRLSRALLVKDERNLDRFDVAFAVTFKGVLNIATAVETQDPPEEWLRRMIERYLSPEERAQIEKLGFDKLMETLRQRLAEQRGRHQGGSKWIGTGGTSPFGAYGDHPEGVRIGQDKGRRGSAVKVWDRRDFKDFDGDAELGPRNIKVALRRLRRFAREGTAEELDLDGTIRSTADKGYIDVQLRPERRNAVKVSCSSTSADRWIGTWRRPSSCFPPPKANSSGSTISTFTTVSTRACGKTTAAVTTSACPRVTSSIHFAATIVSSSSATLQ